MICFLEFFWRSCEIIYTKGSAKCKSLTFLVNVYSLTSGGHLTYTELLIYSGPRFISLHFHRFIVRSVPIQFNCNFPEPNWSLFPWLDFSAWLIEFLCQWGGGHEWLQYKCPLPWEQTYAGATAAPKLELSQNTYPTWVLAPFRYPNEGCNAGTIISPIWNTRN